MNEEELRAWDKIFTAAARYGAELRGSIENTSPQTLTATLVCILLRDAVRAIVEEQKNERRS